ncbi:hypothetical protein [Neisseria elongata]|mgnify:FL=1|jgi:hypothetical protein|uniref:hypothetical protein n=1 Tax=Neisseria elongata TaxID=495 RepID=UPI0006693EF7|nr:hypothetical protein [Neisseria elongata]
MKKLDDKEQAMYIAKKFQKRMLIPKIFFISVVCISGAATLQEIVTNNNFLKKDIFLLYLLYIGLLDYFFVLFIFRLPAYVHIAILFKNLMANHLRLMLII